MRTFRIGGIHPPENKLSAGKKITALAAPKQVIIPLSQHIGAPAQAVVKKGDMVKVGTLLAKAGGFVSANIHSSVSGKVNKIDNAIDASGYRRPAVFIDVEGDEWEETIDRSETLVKECNLSAKEIIDKIAAAGVVGMGGATFPTQVKLMPPPGSKAEIVIVNAVECEPYLTADHSLMLAKGEQILVGVTILMKAVGVNRAVIGIENNKPDAIAHMQKLAAQYPGVEIMPLKVKYPQGGEKQLIDAVIGKQVKSGALPISAGAIVQNVGTVYAVYEAVQKNKPLFERVVTVTGKAVKEPSNFLVRMGTPISVLIEAAGGMPENTGKIIGGGPMMGKALISAEVPLLASIITFSPSFLLTIAPDSMSSKTRASSKPESLINSSTLIQVAEALEATGKVCESFCVGVSCINQSLLLSLKNLILLFWLSSFYLARAFLLILHFLDLESVAQDTRR